MTQLMALDPSPYFNVLLDKLVIELKYYGYPMVELVDIISIWIILDYVLSDDVLIESYTDYIRRAVSVMDEILGDGLYVKIEPKIISIESEFYQNIAPSKRQFSNRLSLEIKKLIF